MRIRVFIDKDENEVKYISSVVQDTSSITQYPGSTSAIYVDEIEDAKTTLTSLGIDIQPIIDFENI